MLVPIYTGLCSYIHDPVQFNSLATSDAIWRHRIWSTLFQVMACCLTAPSHYLNQCWLIIECVPWHSPVSNITKSAHEFNPSHAFRDYTTSFSGQWVNRWSLGDVAVISNYRKTSNIRRTKSPSLNGHRLVLQSSLPNGMKPCVKSRMKM